MQQGILFHALRAPESTVYVNRSVITLEGEVDRAAMEFAWQRVVSRHQVLRCSFFWDGLSKPVQAVHSRVTMPVEWLQKDAAMGRAFCFDLRRPPQMNIAVIRESSAVHHLVWTRHHILFDGWSQALLLKEVFLFFEAYRLAGSQFDEVQLAGAPVQFENYIRWLQQHAAGGSERFWRDHLAGFREPTRICTSPSSAPAPQRETMMELDATLAATIQGLAMDRLLTVSAIQMAAWAVVAGWAAGRRDVVFGLTVAGRPASMPGAESIVGLFINTLPVRALMQTDQKFLDVAAGLQLQQVSLTEHQHSPLADIQRWSEIEPGASLFESIVVIGNYPADFIALQQNSILRVSRVRGEVQNSFPLTLRVMPGAVTRVSLLFDTTRISSQRADLLLEAWVTVLWRVASQFQVTIAELEAKMQRGDEAQSHASLVAGRS